MKRPRARISTSLDNVVASLQGKTRWGLSIEQGGFLVYENLKRKQNDILFRKETLKNRLKESQIVQHYQIIYFILKDLFLNCALISLQS